MKEAGFVHLHNHTEYSLLDGASRIKQLAARAAEFRMPALAITDHGNLFGAVEFFKAAQAAGVKPIIGCEVYVAPRSRTDKVANPDVPESSFHLTLLCETLEGYQNLVKLVSAGYLEGFYYKPRIDKELLAQHNKGLIAMSACLKGEVNYWLNRDNYDRARAAAADYQQIMGKENFYLEVMRIGIPDCAKVEPGAKRIGQELGIKTVATNDCHYLRRQDAEAQDALVCLQTGKRVKDKARLKFGTDQIYFRSPDEMAQVFADEPEMLQTSLEIAQRCNVLMAVDGKKFFLPNYPRPPEYESDLAMLKEVTEQGLCRRYPEPAPEARTRVEHELTVIAKMGFAGYFLIVKDIVDHARSQGIPVGPGRGSAVGSLVLFALGITDVDPLQYGLIFERFLTAERITLPDIDVDFADNRRPEVISYIRERYGEHCVAQIVTFGTLAARASVRDVGRVLDVPLAEVDRLAKLIPFDSDSLAQALKKTEELRRLVDSRPEYQKLFEIAQRVEGAPRHASIHASGVVITPKPLTDLVPLYKSNEGDVCTQFDMNSLEATGLLKMDVLGLRTLTVVDNAVKLLAAEGITLEPEKLPLDDGPTFELLRRADVVGVFQLESGGMRNLLTQTQPENLEEIMAVISLFRPGPMGNIDINDYIGRKKGTIKDKLMHPVLDVVLKDTHGVIIYQEQVMKIANLIAGFSMSEADRLRRVMGKKIADQMGPMREKFMAGARKQHVPEKTARAIFDLIEPFAGYGFNKSHAAGYAMLSYLTAYLKANYPVEFLTASLTSEIGSSDKLRKFVNEARHMNRTLLGPDVNRSDHPFTIETDAPGEKAIRFGLGGIKNLGEGVCAGIVKERAATPYESFTDFIKRTRGFINRKAYESLVMAGALDCFNPVREELLALLPKEIEKATSARAAMLDRQFSLFGDEPKPEAAAAPKPAGPVPESQHHAYEKSALGFYLSSHPLEEFRQEMEVLKIARLEDLAERARDETLTVAGVITSHRTKKDKNGRDYVILGLEDLTAGAEVMIFNNLLESCRKLIKSDELILVSGKPRSRGEGQATIWADAVWSLKEARGYLKSLTIVLRPDALDEAALLEMRRLLMQYPGNAAVFFQVSEDGNPRTARVNDLQVLPSTRLVRQLQALPVVKAARINGRLPREG